MLDTLKGILTHQAGNNNFFTEEQIIQIIQNIALGLKVLHNAASVPIMHRNIAVSNTIIKYRPRQSL